MYLSFDVIGIRRQIETGSNFITDVERAVYAADRRRR